MDNFVEVRQVLNTLLRRWWILLIGAVIAALIGYGVSLMQTPVYAATTTLYVGRPIKSSDLERTDLQLGAQLALTYADLVRRKPVLKGTLEALRLTSTWQELRSRVGVTLVENTQLLEIRVRASSPSEAQLTADEIARQLILLGPIAGQSARSEETRQFAEQRLSQLQINIEMAQQRLDELEARMTAAIGSSLGQAPLLQTEVRTLETLIAEWDSTYSRLVTYLNVEPSVNHLAIVETAEVNLTPVQPRVELNMLLAVVMGLLLAGGLIFLLEYLDDTLKPTDVVSEILGVATVGSVSQLKGKNPQEKLIFRQDLFSPASEDFRLLRNKLQVLCADWPRKVIMVTSPMPGEFKSITVANLGVVLAQAGLRVFIVDTNLRQPMQHTLFQRPNRRGLSELLYAPQLELDTLLEKTDVPNLHLLPAGASPPPHPSELLGSARMGELLDQLAVKADIVLCDSAHAVAIADAVALSSQVDGVMLVIELRKTRRGAAEQAVYNLRQGGANLLGIVLNRLDASPVTTAKFKPKVAPLMNGHYAYDREQVREWRTNHHSAKPRIFTERK